MPNRIQLRRTKGWRKPEGAIVVARPTRWGNPINWAGYPTTVAVGDEGEREHVPDAERRRWAVIDFDDLIQRGSPRYPSLAEIRKHLAGHDLACWCPLDHWCHADVLLRIANPPETP